MSGPGKIWIKESEVANRSWGGPILLKSRVHLYNFNIDVPKLKPEHEKFLSEKVIPALANNREARVILSGSASRSGENNHNNVLSAARAESVSNRLSAAGVDGVQITDTIGLGSPRVGPIEDEGDRAVFILISYPITIEEISIRTDDWTRELVWDDIVELGGVDKKSLQKLNLQVQASGAPRVWHWDGKDFRIMLDPFPLEAIGKRNGRTIPRNVWPLSIAPSAVQPSDPFQTIYRDADSARNMGFISLDQRTGVATIARASVEIDLGLDNWAERGFAVQGLPSSVDEERPDAKRLLEAGGVEVLMLAGNQPRRWLMKWLLRSPAEVFFYSGNGNRAGCLSWVGECWANADFVLNQWRGLSKMKVLIIGAPHVLLMNNANGFALGGPGEKWASLLKNKRGPLTAILGYRDDSPNIKDVGKDIAHQMGARIAAGLKDDEWAQSWLFINAEHSGSDTWNGVAMDQNGYWWIEARSAWSRSFDKVPFISGDKYNLVGPAKIP
jgi:hypothetical protein